MNSVIAVLFLVSLFAAFAVGWATGESPPTYTFREIRERTKADGAWSVVVVSALLTALVGAQVTGHTAAWLNAFGVFGIGYFSLRLTLVLLRARGR